ncbi:hypothetical protein C4564_02695 [Candidatus Microgenomates bacterium]|nr:MAG: hypothetical protein C4564_02695 [Candidatus Microgenomates bacterium]
MKNLNIKTLAKGMRVEDKAKLLFADRNKRAETQGKEGILTPDEEKAIIEDAQDLHQITELNRLNKLFNIASFLVLDIQTAYLHFRLAEGRLLTIITGMILVGEADDTLGHAVYDLASQGYSKEQLDDKKIQDEVDQKAESYRKKYKKDGLNKLYSHFELPLVESSTKTEMLSQPSPILQRAFMMVITEIKRFRKQVYTIEYVVAKARMEFLSETEKQTIENFSEEINKFVNLEGHLGLIQMFVDFVDNGMLSGTNLNEHKFIDSVRDMQKATRLRNKAKRDAKEEIEKVIQKQIL